MMLAIAKAVEAGGKGIWNANLLQLLCKFQLFLCRTGRR